MSFSVNLTDWKISLRKKSKAETDIDFENKEIQFYFRKNSKLKALIHEIVEVNLILSIARILLNYGARLNELPRYFKPRILHHRVQSKFGELDFHFSRPHTITHYLMLEPYVYKSLKRLKRRWL